MNRFLPGRHDRDSVRILVVADFMSAKINHNRNLKIATTYKNQVLGQTHERDILIKLLHCHCEEWNDEAICKMQLEIASPAKAGSQ